MRRIAGLAVLVAYALNLGCSSLREVPVSEVQGAERVSAVTYPSGEIVEFNEKGGIVNSYKGTIDGTTTKGIVVSIPLDDVLHVRVERTDTTRTTVWTVAVLGVIVAAVYAMLSQIDYSFL